ncbi:MAG TPA: hypothetical protein VFL83_04655 [Anaeromyxobacter sp.]|nr:hypothetical protein [Anaeromyxobacter sp.]
MALVEVPLEAPPETGVLEATLVVPERARSVVLFVHGDVPSACCPRDAAVAHELEHAGFATLLVDLLTPREADEDVASGRHALDLPKFARRLVGITSWLDTFPATRALRVGYFGAGTGAVAALAAAAELSRRVEAVVSCGGRVDLVDRSTLAHVKAPVLLVEGTAEGSPRACERDERVLGMSRAALDVLPSGRLAVVRGATHWLGEPDAFGAVAHLALEWFTHHLASPAPVEPKLA